MINHSVEILLGAYNGERFIAEQIESILGQTCTDWKLIIRDDGSTDGTRKICASYVAKHPDRIELLDDGRGNLGVVGNFDQLLARSQSPYVMFCDQDDVWLPEKVERELAEIQALERDNGAKQPLAIFTDALVVDENLGPISNSLLTYINRKRFGAQPLNRLCVEGNCYGCTMIMNRSLVDNVRRLPRRAISHDWWYGMAAAAFGKLVYVDCAPLKHRRHASNSSATKRNSLFRYLRERTSLARHRQWLHRVLEQGEEFGGTYAKQLNDDQKRLFRDLSLARRSNWVKRRILLMRHGIRMTGLGRNVGFFLAL